MTIFRYQLCGLWGGASRQVKPLYLSAFPENERFPFSLLVLNGFRKNHRFEAIYDGDVFIGLVYYCYDANFFYLLFFAVSQNVQSQGYGSRIMEDLKEKAGQRTFILMAEAIDDAAENAHQRQRRIAFYDRQGFSVTDYDYVEREDTYHLLASQPDFSAKQFEQFAKKAVCSLLPISVVKR